MTKFQRKPEYVEAFQMTEELQSNELMPDCPDWAKESRKKDYRTTGAIFPTNPESPINGLTLKTTYGEFPIPIGSWIVKNKDNFMIVANNHFEAGFEPIIETSTPPAKTTPPKETKQPAAVS